MSNIYLSQSKPGVHTALFVQNVCWLWTKKSTHTSLCVSSLFLLLLPHCLCYQIISQHFSFFFFTGWDFALSMWQFAAGLVDKTWLWIVLVLFLSSVDFEKWQNSINQVIIQFCGYIYKLTYIAAKWMLAIGGSTSAGASWRGVWVKERLVLWFNLSHEIVCRVPSLDLVILGPASSTETNKRAACQQYTECNDNCGADYLWKHTHANFSVILWMSNWSYRVGSM